jgi:hypothetical protein
MKKKEFVKPFLGEVIAEGRINVYPYWLDKRTLLLFSASLFLFSAFLYFRLDILSALLKFNFQVVESFELSFITGLLFGIFMLIILCGILYPVFFIFGMNLLEILGIKVVKVEIEYYGSSLCLRKKNEQDNVYLYENYKVIVTGRGIELYSMHGARILFSRKTEKKLTMLGDFSDVIFDISPEYVIPLKKKFRLNSDELSKYIFSKRIDMFLESISLFVDNDIFWNKIHSENNYDETCLYRDENNFKTNYNYIIRLEFVVGFVSNEFYDFVMNGYCYPQWNRQYHKNFGYNLEKIKRQEIFLERLNKLTGKNYQFVNKSTREFTRLAFTGQSCSERNAGRIRVAEEYFGSLKETFEKDDILNESKYAEWICLYVSNE